MRNWLLLFFFSGIVLTACKDKDDDGTGDMSHKVAIRLTDASGPYDEVNIDVQSIEVGTDNGWHTLSTNAGIYDLTELTNGIDTLLASGTIVEGKITQIRLILGANNTVVVDGQSHPLKTPSAQQSGLKLQVNETLTPGVTYTILLDFDAARSIVEKGNGGYSLKPVIRTITQANSGAIKGMIAPTGASAKVYAITGTDSTGALPDAMGAFLVRGLAAGSYSVYIDGTTPYRDTTLAGVGVTIGNVTDVGSISIQ